MYVTVTPVPQEDGSSLATIGLVDETETGPVIACEVTVAQDDYDTIMITLQNKRGDVWTA